MQGRAKFSFHQSGSCRWAMIKEGKSGDERAIHVWMRAPIPPVGENQAVELLSIAFPTTHLSRVFSREHKKLIKLEAAPLGKAIVIQLFLTAEAKEVVENQFMALGQRSLIFWAPLRGGWFAGVASSVIDCGRVDLTMPAGEDRKSVFGRMQFPQDDVNDTGRPIRLVTWSGKTTPPMLWELGGFEEHIGGSAIMV